MRTQVEKQQFNSNNETFVTGTYHGISILIRESDGFVNATKLCSQFKTNNGEQIRYRNITQNDTWNEFFDTYKEELGVAGKTAALVYELRHGFSDKYTGQYIHPQLINGLICLISPKYMIYVSKIMDILNERIQITNEKNEELIKNLQKEVEKLKRNLES